jgi:hypothetical protein
LVSAAEDCQPGRSGRVGWAVPLEGLLGPIYGAVAGVLASAPAARTGLLKLIGSG